MACLLCRWGNMDLKGKCLNVWFCPPDDEPDVFGDFQFIDCDQDIREYEKFYMTLGLAERNV